MLGDFFFFEEKAGGKMKKIFILLIILLSVGCGQEETQELNLEVNGNAIGYQLESSEDDYLVPLLLILDALEINYEQDDNTIIFGDIEVIIGSDIAFVDGNARDLGKPLLKEEGYVLISLQFLTSNLNLGYVQDEESINIRQANSILIDYQEALEIFGEGKEAIITDVETGETFNVRRIEDSHKRTIADVETLTAEDTEILKELIGGEWNFLRRAIIVEIDEVKIAGAIIPSPHMGRSDRPFGEVVDNRSGNTGRGINLNSITDNDLEGVLDIYFYNSITPGLNRIDERAQEKVLEASYFYR